MNIDNFKMIFNDYITMNNLENTVIEHMNQLDDNNLLKYGFIFCLENKSCLILKKNVLSYFNPSGNTQYNDFLEEFCKDNDMKLKLCKPIIDDEYYCLLLIMIRHKLRIHTDEAIDKMFETEICVGDVNYCKIGLIEFIKGVSLICSAIN